MALSTQPYKGARDFYPEDKALQNYIFKVMRDAVKKYGYQEYDAPILEPLELYKAKSGDEIVNEQTYNFVDRGGREVTIRPEMTPTVSRMVAVRRQELGYPLRWFSIPNLWRYERPQRGRLREHWQLNVDLFGEAGIAADHEMIQVADSVLKAFGATPDMYKIRLNSRTLVNDLFGSCLGLNEEKAVALAKLLDKMNKIKASKFEVGLADICGEKADRVKDLLAAKTLDNLPAEFQSHKGAANLQQLLELLEQSGIINVEFDMSLMRGFDYYTDIVFEVFDTDPENNRSMFGGGRYDGLVGLFGVDPVPTVGFGMGDVTLANFLESHSLLPEIRSEINAAILVLGNFYQQANALAQTLRAAGLNISLDATDRKLEKKIKSADKQNVTHIIIVGENEAQSGEYKLKNLTTGQEINGSAKYLSEIIKDASRKKD
jgi:histidyl-tRNA synthetase